MKKLLRIIAVCFIPSLSWAHNVPGPAAGTAIGVLVNVADFGAACDGVTDDTKAIQNAVAHAEAAPQRPIYLRGRCVVSSTISFHNYNNQSFPLAIECTGGGSGFLWGGADNTGPVIAFGDSTGAHNSFGVRMRGCFVTGKDSSHKPSAAIALYSDQNSWLENVGIGTGNGVGNIYKGVTCTVGQCLMTKIDGAFFACHENCVHITVPDDGSKISLANFYLCGGWCYYNSYEAGMSFDHNYFEGQIATTRGFVRITGSGSVSANFFGNVYETTGSHAGFQTINLDGVGTVNFFGDNFLNGNAGGGTVGIVMSGNIAANFYEVTPSTGTDGYFIKTTVTSGNFSKFVGGYNCDPNNIVEGAGANISFALIFACGTSKITPYGYGASNTSYFSVASNGAIGTQAIKGAGSAAANAYTGTCSVSALGGGATIGYFTNGTNSCTGTVKITWGPAVPAAPTEWSCSARDLTDPTKSVVQSAADRVSATFALTSVAYGDKIQFSCFAY